MRTSEILPKNLLKTFDRFASIFTLQLIFRLFFFFSFFLLLTQNSSNGCVTAQFRRNKRNKKLLFGTIYLRSFSIFVYIFCLFLLSWTPLFCLNVCGWKHQFNYYYFSRVTVLKISTRTENQQPHLYENPKSKLPQSKQWNW